MKPILGNRGTISFVFDDGYERVYQNVLPLLRQHKFPAVFALPLDAPKLAKTEQRAIKPWREWLNIRSEGHEIASHSVSHPNLTKRSDQQLEYELTESKEKLQATTIVYPGGAFDARVSRAAGRHYAAGRTVHYGFETIPPKHPLQLKSYNFSRNNFTVLKANRLALWAYLTDSWLIETYHMVDNDDSQMVHTVRTDDFARHLAFISKLPLTVKTIQAVTTD